MSDPVAPRSGFLCQYMSSHPDTLVAYVVYFGKVKEPLQSARMESIDSGGMNLSYVCKDGKGTTGKVRVKFDPPLISYDEVRPRLTAMKYDAEEQLGMIKAPPLTTFSFPPSGLLGFALVLIVNILFFKPAPYTGFANTIVANMPGGTTVVAAIWGILTVLHALEALWAGFLCRRHRAGAVLGATWTLTIFLAGYPVLVELRQIIQRARIASIKSH
ncbi:hypothetical protein EXIGLDRAFT_720587 [Exidia glandulosa HHB12029]|uniref:DUF2470 domain-containing protein n=1 Tax=Exidia glandulosa HHB12029 TaxID=1314781 RepID=A0A165GBK7_EXIGL|nr:hypothetical protein EXIGLDRAFT_720587 [Exidia glandulosa HHB12029]